MITFSEEVAVNMLVMGDRKTLDLSVSTDELMLGLDTVDCGHTTGSIISH